MQVRHESSNLIEVNFSVHCSSFINGTAEKGGGLSIYTHKGGSFLIINSTFTLATLSSDAHGGEATLDQPEEMTS